MNVFKYNSLVGLHAFGSIKAPIETFSLCLMAEIMNEKKRLSFLKKRVDKNDFKNCAIVFCGNLGLDKHNDEKICGILSELNEKIKGIGAHLFFVRGNEDDPDLYRSQKYAFSNITFLPDFAILELNNFNCLCVGGGISLDRLWKLKNEKRSGEKQYYENEATSFDFDEARELLKDHSISAIISYDTPTFCGTPLRDYKKKKWFRNDNELLNDVISNRVILNKLYDELMFQSTVPYYWFSPLISDFSMNITLNDIRIIRLDASHSSFLNELVYNKFGVKLNPDGYFENSSSEKTESNTIPQDDMWYSTVTADIDSPLAIVDDGPNPW